MLLNKLLKSLAIVGFLFAHDSIGYTEKNVNQSVERIYTAFCSGKFDSTALEIQKIRPDDVAYIPSKLIYSLSREGQLQMMSLASLGDADIEKLNQADRVLMAEALLMSRSADIIKIKKILAFNAKDPTVESYRNFADGTLDIMSGQIDHGLKKLKTAIDNLSFIDPSLLLNFFGKVLSASQPKSMLKNYVPLIEKIPNGNPSKVNLLAFKDLINSDTYNNVLITEYAKKAYEACSSDYSTGLGYAINLYHLNNDILAKDILLDLVAKNNYYSPLADLYLALIFSRTEDKESAKNYLKKAKDSLFYFDESEKKTIAELERSLNTQFDNFSSYARFFIRYGMVFLITVSLMVVIVIRRRKNRFLNESDK